MFAAPVVPSCRWVVRCSKLGWGGLLMLLGGQAHSQALAAAAASVPAPDPYGLAALWAQGDGVARATLLLMLLMSLASWGVIVSKLVEQQRLSRQARAAQQHFWGAATLAEGLARLEGEGAFHHLAEQGLKAAEQHAGRVMENVDLHTWISMTLQRAVDGVHSRLQDGLALLATVGSTAPFVGLFGTVWGIYHALTGIGISGQASIDKVAGPVGEALIMTAVGLGVAVPAVMGYNALVRRNKRLMEQVRAFAADVHQVLLAMPRA